MAKFFSKFQHVRNTLLTSEWFSDTARMTDTLAIPKEKKFVNICIGKSSKATIDCDITAIHKY